MARKIDMRKRFKECAQVKKVYSKVLHKTIKRCKRWSYK